ncbi:metal-sensitive transcriptional regulator [Parasporobacterium paucivorans]|uniref:DNA-binding transcriptional regulator, FrmR family n=1 Tax=Parasporobacterium paucivorans DSM 15970 TaxID=1122934 RepID=A0A1M6J854_9FIRM|nr:metal-sensitive transcriptional regulator [Parasporobacterium paucivorans]SHJ42844.1 DNA-binding transcriptional regulator, FrmR family [Parasporobacterium paucivorans DSM 15970]
MEKETVEISGRECSTCGERQTQRDDKLKDNLVKRLNRTEGQIRGIKGMVEKDCYCDDILTQISSVQSALNSVSTLVLENHVRSCFVEKIKNGDDEIIDEMLVTIGRLLKR